MEYETKTWPVLVHTNGGRYHWTITNPYSGKIAQRSEQSYADSWEASTAGHNAERILNSKLKERAAA